MTTPPEVRQCLIEGATFGATATKAGDNRWLVAHPQNGGHWASDAEVEGWRRLIAESLTGQGKPAAVQ